MNVGVIWNSVITLVFVTGSLDVSRADMFLDQSFLDLFEKSTNMCRTCKQGQSRVALPRPGKVLPINGYNVYMPISYGDCIDSNHTIEPFYNPSTNIWEDTRCFYIGHDCEIPPKPIPENGAAILYGLNFPTNFSCHYKYNFSSAFGSSKTFHIYLEYNPKQEQKSEIDMDWYPFSVCCT